MGYYVHIHVAFACDENDGVAALASKHLALLGENTEDGIRSARWFLQDLAKRTGGNPGPKGGLSLWGLIGNYTRGDVFCEVLLPFWTDLLTEWGDGGPHEFEHILVFIEPEQTYHMTVFEIFRPEAPDGEYAKTPVIKCHEGLPFCANQF